MTYVMSDLHGRYFKQHISPFVDAVDQQIALEIRKTDFDSFLSHDKTSASFFRFHPIKKAEQCRMCENDFVTGIPNHLSRYYRRKPKFRI